MNTVNVGQRLARFLVLQMSSQATRDLLTTTAANLALTGASAIGGVIAARLLGPDGRGELAIALLFAGILGVVGSLGIAQSLIYSVAHDPSAIGKIFATASVLLVIQSAVILVTGLLVADLWLREVQPTALVAARLYLFSIPATMLLTNLMAMAQGLKRFGVFNTLKLISTTGYLACFLLAWILRLRQATSIVAILLAAQTIASIVALGLFVAQIKPRGSPDSDQGRQLLQYGLRSYWGNLSWVANARLDQFFLTGFVTLADLGYYAVAVSYATALVPLSVAIAMVLFPGVASSRRSEARRGIAQAMKLNLLVSGSGGLLLATLSPLLLPAIFGPQFQPAVLPAIILLGGSIFLGCNYVLGDGLRGLGKPSFPSISEAVGLFVTVGGLFVLVPRIGITGAAVASVLSYGTVTVLLIIGLMPVRAAKAEIDRA